MLVAGEYIGDWIGGRSDDDDDADSDYSGTLLIRGLEMVRVPEPSTPGVYHTYRVVMVDVEVEDQPAEGLVPTELVIFDNVQLGDGDTFNLPEFLEEQNRGERFRSASIRYVLINMVCK